MLTKKYVVTVESYRGRQQRFCMKLKYASFPVFVNVSAVRYTKLTVIV